MNIELRIYDRSAGRMLYAYEPEEQGKRDYYPFEFGIGFSHWKKKDLSPIMLFTGLEDAYKTKIWEGDVLEDVEGDRWVVEFIDSSFWFVNSISPSNRNTYDWLKDNGYWVGYKVVGNIYEGAK
jgi:hypothetical protein